jgi:hypothetical protein
MKPLVSLFLISAVAFAQSPCSVPGSLAAGASCTLSVTFTPTSTGAKSDTLTITDTPDSLTASGTVSGTGTSSGGTGTATLVQGPTCNNTANGTATPTITLGSALGANHVYIFWASDVGGQPVLNSVTSSASFVGTLIAAAANIAGVASSGHFYNSTYYVLPSTAVGSANSTLTLNFASALGSTAFVCAAEWSLSANASNVALDIDSNIYRPSQASPALGVNATISGTNDFGVAIYGGGGSYTKASAVNSPWSSHVNFPSNAYTAFAATASSPTQSSWTTGGTDTYIIGGLLFGWNPTSGVEQWFLDTDNGTNGTQLSQANLAAVMTGFQGGFWANTGCDDTACDNDIKFDTAAAYGLNTSSGRQYGDGSTYTAGTGGTLGVTFTSNSTGTNEDAWQYEVTSSIWPTTSFGAWVKTDLACTQTFNTDILSLGTISGGDFVNVKMEASSPNCFFSIETQSGAGAGGSVTFNSGQWYWIDEFFTSTAGTNNQTIKVYTCTSGAPPDCTLSQVGSTMTGNAVGGYNVQEFHFGVPNHYWPANGHVYFNGFKASLTGVDPLLP